MKNQLTYVPKKITGTNKQYTFVTLTITIVNFNLCCAFSFPAILFLFFWIKFLFSEKSGGVVVIDSDLRSWGCGFESQSCINGFFSHFDQISSKFTFWLLKKTIDAHWLNHADLMQGDRERTNDTTNERMKRYNVILSVFIKENGKN